MAGQIDLVVLTADIVSSYVGNNPVALRDIGTVIRTVHGGLARIGTPKDMLQREGPRPAVPITDSIQPDYLVNLFNGQRFKTLKGTLARNHGMTPREYRAYWGLPGNYPMVAPNYSAKRQAIARAAGLGSRIKPGDSVFLPEDREDAEPVHTGQESEADVQEAASKRRHDGTLGLKI